MRCPILTVSIRRTQVWSLTYLKEKERYHVLANVYEEAKWEGLGKGKLHLIHFRFRICSLEIDRVSTLQTT
jgi:hypothetical protein